jgi:hypothetical protein
MIISNKYPGSPGVLSLKDKARRNSESAAIDTRPPNNDTSRIHAGGRINFFRALTKAADYFIKFNKADGSGDAVKTGSAHRPHNESVRICPAPRIKRPRPPAPHLRSVR